MRVLLHFHLLLGLAFGASHLVRRLTSRARNPSPRFALPARLDPRCAVAVVGGGQEEGEAARTLRLPYIPIATTADLGRIAQFASTSTQAADGACLL